jgi:uncharacterized protein YgiB involved in biofilm formation
MAERKSSAKVTLVLIGVAALAGCGRTEEQRRDVYATREDCLADWGNKPEDCKPATEPRHASFGYSTSSGWTPRSGARSIGSSTAGSSSSVSRGGFGSSSRSSGG